MADAKGIGTINTAGENNVQAKLSQQKVEEIRYLWQKYGHLSCRRRKELGITVPALAETYEVHKGTISRIINRKNWVHLKTAFQSPPAGWEIPSNI